MIAISDLKLRTVILNHPAIVDNPTVRRNQITGGSEFFIELQSGKFSFSVVCTEE